MIPKILFQTSKIKIEQYVVDITQSFLDNNWTYLYFSDEDIINFFKQNPIEEFPDIAEVFNIIPRGEYKADLFRYYYLYINGGVYIDSDFELTKNLNEYVEKYEFISVVSGSEADHDAAFNGVLAATPRNKIIYEALTHAYSFFKNKEVIPHYEFLCVHLKTLINSHSHEYNIKLFGESDLVHIAVVYDTDTFRRIGIHYHGDGYVNPVELKIKSIYELYQRILKREPDKLGLRYYVNSHLSLKEIERELLLSVECGQHDYEGGVPVNLNLYNYNYNFYIHNPQLDRVISRDILITGCWELPISNIWMQHIQPGDLVLDIGANIGWYSKLSELRGAKPISVEPNLKNLKVLKNNVPTAEIHEVCLGSAPGTVELAVTAPENRGAPKIMQYYDTRTPVEVQTCVMDTMDNIVGDRASKIKAVKMDVEGYELQVLSGGKSTIENLPSGCLVIFEVVTAENFYLKDFDFLLNRMENAYALCSNGRVCTLEELDAAPKSYAFAMGHVHYDVIGTIK